MDLSLRKNLLTKAKLAEAVGAPGKDLGEVGLGCLILLLLVVACVITAQGTVSATHRCTSSTSPASSFFLVIDVAQSFSGHWHGSTESHTSLIVVDSLIAVVSVAQGRLSV